MADANLKTVAEKLGTTDPHLYLAVDIGEHCDLRFPDGRRLNISCTPDEYSIVDQQGRVLLSVERNLNGGKPGWDNVEVTWPEDDRFKGERSWETTVRYRLIRVRQADDGHTYLDWWDRVGGWWDKAAGSKEFTGPDGLTEAKELARKELAHGDLPGVQCIIEVIVE